MRRLRPRNSGTGPLRCEVSDPQNEFFTYVGRGQAVVQPGKSWPVSVRFAPWAPGRRRAVLRITSDSPYPPEKHIVVRLVGKGVGSALDGD